MTVRNGKKTDAERGGRIEGAGTALSGAEIVVESLLRNGAGIVFGFPGGAVIPLYDAILSYRDRLKHVLVRHEQGAIHAAQAYARASGRPGVVISTSGPGASNLITGIMDARLDSTPLVVLGGQVATHLIGKDAFQECDMMGMTNPITKHNFHAEGAGDLARIIDQAFHIAATGRPGPVYVDLPRDVQLQKSAASGACELDLPYYLPSRPPDPDCVARAAAIIRDAGRPVLIIGQGAVLAGATDVLRALAHDLQIPVVTTILAKGAFDENDPLGAGCFGMHGRRSANYAVTRSDVIIAFGCRFSDRVTGEPGSFAEGRKIIHVDIDAYEIDKNVPAHLPLNCDAREAADLLYGLLKGFRGTWVEDGWTARVARYRGICRDCLPDGPGGELHPKRVMQVLNEYIRDDDIVTTGVGQHQMFASHYLVRSKPRTFITSGGAGTMGFGLPAAVGAAAARPGVKVYDIDGDGSFQMTIQELGTLVQNRSNVTVVILDNGYLGMVRQWQELYHAGRYSSVRLSNNPDFVKIAGAYGMPGRMVSDEEGLRAALRESSSLRGGFLIHVAVQKESNIVPMVPPGGKLTDFTGYCVGESGNFFPEDETGGAT